MGAGLSKVLIVTLVLVSFGIITTAAAQEGMWHSANEIGPGTFKAGTYIFPEKSNITGNANLLLNIRATDLGGNEYSHNLSFPYEKNGMYGLVLKSNGVPLTVETKSTSAIAMSVLSWYTPAALFDAQTSRPTATFLNWAYSHGYGGGPAAYFYNENSTNPTIIVVNDDPYGPSIKAVGRADVVGDLNVTAGQIKTPSLCLNGVCKNAWPGGGTGGGLTEYEVLNLIYTNVPSLEEVTRGCKFGANNPNCNQTTVGITTAGLKLKSGAVINSESGNVIIKLGT